VEDKDNKTVTLDAKKNTIPLYAAEVEWTLIECYKMKHNKNRPLANKKDGG
jgi:hypothetical protein